MTGAVNDSDLYAMVQSQQAQFAAQPSNQPAGQPLLDRLGIGVMVPLSPLMTELVEDAALGYASYQLYRLGQRMEDAAAGVPELHRYPKDVQKRVRAEYTRQKRQARQAERASRKRSRRGAIPESSMSTKWWRSSNV